MQTIYWIQRLGELHIIAWVAFSIFICAMIVGFMMVVTNVKYVDTLDSCKREYEAGRKLIKITPWFIGVSMLVGVFTPSENQLYVIYGIGGTIDYIKSNDTAKQLPDKVVNVLDAWIDKQTENKE